MTRARDNAVSGLVGAKNQAREQTRHLGEAEEQLKIAKKLIEDLKAKVAAAEGAQRVAEWSKDEALRAKAEADFGREEALAAKEEAEAAAYAEGVAEIKAVYKAQVPGAEALKQAGVEASSDLWKVESVYYPPAICEAAPDGAKVGEVVEEVGATPGEGASVAESKEDPSEKAPQEAANVPSNAQIPTTEEAAILAVPLQAIPLGQSSEDPEVASIQPFTGGEID
ncbi:uncharacterized protein LOC136065078 [Quercus suber]|uniref:uncharacterized protein LOC136065078 n=1 Tax=Quercus suber TaxID=58331 RepID=UPI0032DFAA50